MSLKDFKESIFGCREEAPCFYCKVPLSFSEATVDHLVPKARGGGEGETNFVLACEPCNIAKADLTDWEFIPLLPTLNRCWLDKFKMRRLCMDGPSLREVFNLLEQEFLTVAKTKSTWGHKELIRVFESAVNRTLVKIFDEHIALERKENN